MRVGILSQWFPPETGPASIPGVLAKGLVERGHEVTVLTGFPNYPTGELYDGYTMKPRRDERVNGYRIRRVALHPDHSDRVRGRMMNYGSFAATASTLGLSALAGIDVLWVYNSPVTVAVPMWLTKARYRTPIVLHNMDMWPDSLLHTGVTGKQLDTMVLPLLGRWVSAMYRSARFVAYITPEAGRELGRRGVPAHKLVHLPLWVDETVFRPAEDDGLRKRLGYREGDIVIGYAGALGEAQRVEDLLDAVLAQPPSSSIRCLVLGTGTRAQAIERYARQHPTRIQYLGSVPHEQMTSYAAVPDISYVGLAASAQSMYAAPSKVLAVLASGKPLLVSAHGDTRELAVRSGAALLADPGNPSSLRDAVRLCELKGRSELATMGQTASEFSRRHLSSSVGVTRTEQVLVKARYGG